MKKLILAMVCGFGFQGLALGADMERCNQIRERMKQGVQVKLELEATDLFDASQQLTHQIEFLLVPTVYDQCLANDAEMSNYFFVGKGAQLRTARGTYSAVFDAEWPHVVTGKRSDPSTQLNAGKLTAYHAVFAAIMREIGYDTFESATGSPFPTLLDQMYLKIPSDQQATGLVGVGGVRGRLHQLMIKRVAITMP